MIRKLFGFAALASLSTAQAVAGTKDFTTSGYSLPADKPVTVVLMRPDVQVGLLTTGGVPEVNADWTMAAINYLRKALEQNQKARGIDLRVLDAQEGEAAQLVGDYEALHRAVATAVLTHKVAGVKLPTKKDQFDWTLGPGVQRIGDLSGGNYALFLYSRDNFASAGRQAMQAAGLLGCLVGFCVIASGGQHIAYASLVELSTGKVVWFNMMRGSQGDVREEIGAKSMVDVLMASMPTKAGEGNAPAGKRKAKRG